MSVVQHSILRLYAVFTFGKEKRNISNVSLLYCQLSFCTVHQKRFFCIEILNWDLKSVRRKVSAKNCPLRRGFLVVIVYETKRFLKKVCTRSRCPLQRSFTVHKILSARTGNNSLMNFLCTWHQRHAREHGCFFAFLVCNLPYHIQDSKNQL